MKGLAELSRLHENFAELKMDVTSTEAGLKRELDEAKQKIGFMEQTLEKAPQFQELAVQDKALRANIERIEAKRAINRDASKRGMINEIIVRNY